MAETISADVIARTSQDVMGIVSPITPPSPLSIVLEHAGHAYGNGDTLLPSHFGSVNAGSEVTYTSDGKIKVPSGTKSITTMIASSVQQLHGRITPIVKAFSADSVNQQNIGDLGSYVDGMHGRRKMFTFEISEDVDTISVCLEVDSSPTVKFQIYSIIFEFSPSSPPPAIEFRQVYKRCTSCYDTLFFLDVRDVKTWSGVTFTPDGKIKVPSGTKTILVTVSDVCKLRERMNLYVATNLVDGKMKLNHLVRYTPLTTPSGSDTFTIAVGDDVDSISIHANIDSAQHCDVRIDQIRIEFILG